MDLRFIDWIWHVRGSLALAPGQTNDDAFDRLAPLFRQTGTRHERSSDVLTFTKKDQAAQDKMSIFDSGALRIERGVAGLVLRYHLISRALLLCFLAPLMFLGFAQLTLALMKWQAPAIEAAAKGPKLPKKIAEPAVLNPIDKFLGAPEPEKPKAGEENAGRGRKPSTTPAYVFAAIFATLYLVGRILEDWLIKSAFRKRLLGAA